MSFAQRRNHLTTHFSECILVVKQRMTVLSITTSTGLLFTNVTNYKVLTFKTAYVVLSNGAIVKRLRFTNIINRRISRFKTAFVLMINGRIF
jgi:hypothetical protein